MKPIILTFLSFGLLTWQLNAGAVCELKNVSKNIPGTIVSGYCSNNNDQVSCSRSVGQRWTCRGVMGVYSSMELGKAIADSCSCQWSPSPKPEDKDPAILDASDLNELNDNDHQDSSKDILDYFMNERN